MGIPKLSTWNMKFKATDSQTLLYFNLENELSAIAIERRLPTSCRMFIGTCKRLRIMVLNF
ncbi:hypothetical protein I3842_10G103300 [Carya illinoinensis]|uniref:Uncharacterized protein n=1 Tax=Carya illinoinensis TaxID=32201 RepID=A0A922J4U6_CARIL|nr:hypothetical protein I3842_10G103300 [Carya illinoinensis]